VNGRFRKKGNTPYKWYNPDIRQYKKDYTVHDIDPESMENEIKENKL